MDLEDFDEFDDFKMTSITATDDSMRKQDCQPLERAIKAELTSISILNHY